MQITDSPKRTARWKLVAAAISDPGQTEGYKGERTLTEWQADAVERALAALSQAEPAGGAGREGKPDVRQIIADIRAGAADGFVNDGAIASDALNCPHCGGSGHVADVSPAPAGVQAEPVAELLHEIRDNGLIYWVPTTDKGLERRNDMIARIDDFLASPPSAFSARLAEVERERDEDGVLIDRLRLQNADVTRQLQGVSAALAEMRSKYPESADTPQWEELATYWKSRAEDAEAALRRAAERFNQIDCVTWGGQTVQTKDDCFDHMKALARAGAKEAEAARVGGNVYPEGVIRPEEDKVALYRSALASQPAQAVPIGWVAVPREPTGEMMDAARHLFQWLAFPRPTERELLRHCERLRIAPPAECRDVDHVPPKRMMAYWIFRAMLAPASPVGEER